MDFGSSFGGFMDALFTFLGTLFTGVFGWLADFFAGLNVGG
jgi:hypothetical protein